MKYIYDLLINLIYNNKYSFSISIFVLIILAILSFAIINLIISYYIIKYLEINIVNDIYFCNYGYNKKSSELLQKYGDYKIKKIYLVKHPITKLNTFLLNLITFYNYEKTLSNMNEIFKKQCTPYHISFMIEIGLPNKNTNTNTKFLLVEKTSYVNLSEKIHLNNQNIVKTVKLHNKEYTINSLLKETQNRIGEKKFFNWSIYKNNCSIFIKELLITLDLYNKPNIKFITQHKFVKHVKFTSLTLHIINILCTLNNITNNYLY
jgi:hypothetical protein